MRKNGSSPFLFLLKTPFLFFFKNILSIFILFQKYSKFNEKLFLYYYGIPDRHLEEVSVCGGQARVQLVNLVGDPLGRKLGDHARYVLSNQVLFICGIITEFLFVFLFLSLVG